MRIGVTKEWEQRMDTDTKKAYAANPSPKHAGIEGTMDVLKWIWNTGFSAVAGDAISFEVWEFSWYTLVQDTNRVLPRSFRLPPVVSLCTSTC